MITEGQDYLITVKKNQAKLYDALKSHAEGSEALASSQSSEKAHGRQITRCVEVWLAPAEMREKWAGLQSFARVRRYGIRNSKEYEEEMFYMSSLPAQAKKLARIIRQHWQIENNLHWVKDVVLGEDQAAQKAGYAAENLAILRSWVMSLFRLNGYDSITEAMERVSHDIPRLLSLLAC